ncbi:MAG: 23S rRNA (pseudouridine(1915)-N(3))-methyltransferase RlmH [Acidobacteriaceae bacterium]|nr:23S rRNA (pseudouridine(1915)-N(3))-methyltransferase RlmH [Acidobacteriaceae bacterium]
MKLKVGWIGRSKEPATQALTDEYVKRLGRFISMETAVFKDEPSLLKLCTRDARPRYTLVLLDSRGKQFSSEEFATWLGVQIEHSSQPLLFAVGPADGFTDHAKQSASLLLSLGKMTIAHELARVVLLEQLYRAFTILKGHPYHSGH